MNKLKIFEAEFIKVPKPKENDIENTSQEDLNKIFSNMIGYNYKVSLSEFNNEYVILCGTTEKAEREYENSIYKSLIALGESEEYSKSVAYEGEDPDGCMYFEKKCFRFEEDKQ